ncbi:MAG: class I SAM-dependent methyltransferase [Actinomycetota bacterium]
MPNPEPSDQPDLKSAYDAQYLHGRYSRTARSADDGHPRYSVVAEFVDGYSIRDARCLEVGCGKGGLSEVVEDYVGVDLSEVAGRDIRKPFVAASATDLPFRSDAFDAAWTVTTLEHVPDPGRALEELRRVVQGGGLLYIAPAWFCRTWAARGYAVRPYSDFGLGGKLVKASVPIRNSLVWRLPGVVLRRVLRLLVRSTGRRSARTLSFRRLVPSYDVVWTSDSDAVASIDPFDVILWFRDRGDAVLSHPSLWRAFRMRTGAIVVQVRGAS